MAALDVTFPFASSNNIAGRGTVYDKITSSGCGLHAALPRRHADRHGGLDPFDQTGTDVISATMAPVAHDQLLDVKVNPGDVHQPLLGGSPRSGEPRDELEPGRGARLQDRVNAGPALSSGGIAAIDTGVNLMYGNPFVAKNWNTIFTLGTNSSRVYMPVGTTTRSRSTRG